jgi:nucleotide-binding universal stress UspA family protein
MAIKRILVPLAGSAAYIAEIDCAVSVAKTLAAHIEAFYVHQPALEQRSDIMDSGMYRVHGSAALAAQAPPIEKQATEVEQAREHLASSCAANGIPLLQSNQEPDATPSASWRESEGAYVKLAAQRAAAFDLVIAASASVTESLRSVAEQALLETRRPVLLAPAHPTTKLTDEAIIAWDESPECWHAVSAAIPFLEVARSVYVLSVGKNSVDRRSSQADVLAYLHCHDIYAAAQIVAPPPESRSIGDMLLSTAAERDCGLLVMGAYSHSRLRQLFLGGATRDILRNASTRPVLMAH